MRIYFFLVLATGLFVLNSCGTLIEQDSEDYSFEFLDTLKVPIIGENEYLAIDPEQRQLFIRNSQLGIAVYDYKADNVLWSMTREVLDQNDPVSSIGFSNEGLVVLGFKSLRIHSRADGTLQSVHRLPVKLNFDPQTTKPVFTVRSNGKSYFLTDYLTNAHNPQASDPFSMNTDYYFNVRHFSLIEWDQGDSLSVYPIGRFEPDANIVSAEEKIPFIEILYFAVNDTMIEIFAGEPKVWMYKIADDDPRAFASFDLELDYPAINYKLPANQGNNQHDYRRRLDANLQITKLSYDAAQDLFYLLYFRALEPFEMDIVDNPAEKRSRRDLGFQRFRLAVFNKEFEKLAELPFPIEMHTLIGVHDGQVFVKGYDEGEDYDLIYKLGIDGFPKK